MELSQFTKEYLHILYEHRGTVPITIEEYEQFLKTSVKIGKDYSIVTEESFNFIDIPEKAMQFLMNNCHRKIDGRLFKSYLKESRHWRNIKNVDISDIYFDIFDFHDAKAIDSFNFTCFSVSDDALKEGRHLFLENVSNGDLYGFFNTYNGLNVLCVNSKADDIHQVIHHELSHFIQMTGNIRITNGISAAEIKHRDILEKEFEFEYEKVLSYFSGKEFIPHADDIKADLIKCRDIFYKDATGFEFRKDLQEFLKCRTEENVHNNKLYNCFYKMKRGNMDTIMMLLFSKISGYKFQKIMNHIEEAFI